MSVGLDPQQAQNIEQERRRIGRLLDEVSRLCESDIPSINFYSEMLKKLLDALNAPAGAVYLRSAQDSIQRIYQINLGEPNPERDANAKYSHDALIQRAFFQPKPEHLLPNAYYGAGEDSKPPAGNPTSHVLMMVPILLDEKMVGLIEVFQATNRPLNAITGFLQYMGLMADLATRFQRHQKVIQLTGQQALWAQLEAFSRQIHGSLNPIECSYLIANEGRRLVDCDRVSVVARYGTQIRVEGMSGVDSIERRSNLVVLMQTLVKAVIDWGEKLVFKGEQDDSLPPRVLDALDAYLAESSAKLLVIQPLVDERDGKGKDKKKPRAAIVMESFDPPTDPDAMIERLEIVGRHSTSALYNSIEHRRIPLRFLWRPIAAVQEGLGGRTKTIILACIVGLTFLTSILCLWSYPLKMDAQGQLLPAVRVWVYPKREGLVDRFVVNPNDEVAENQELARLYDPKLREELDTLRWKSNDANAQELQARQSATDAQTQKDRARFQADEAKFRNEKNQYESEMKSKIREFNAESSPARIGFFSLRALISLRNNGAWSRCHVGPSSMPIFRTTGSTKTPNRSTLSFV